MAIRLRLGRHSHAVARVCGDNGYPDRSGVEVKIGTVDHTILIDVVPAEERSDVIHRQKIVSDPVPLILVNRGQTEGAKEFGRGVDGGDVDANTNSA